jgi:hypothetical protein
MASHGGIANALVELELGLGAQDRLVGGADGAKHPRQPPHRPLAILARGFVVEIAERE